VGIGVGIAIVAIVVLAGRRDTPAVEETEEQPESAGRQTCAAAEARCSARNEAGRAAYTTAHSRDALNIWRFGTR